MPLISTPAIILATTRYGETSKIVRLVTPEHGVQSAIAKGALRPKSRFGAALQILSSGQAHLLFSERRDLHLLTGFDLVWLPLSLSRDVPRFASATALAEVTLRCGATEPHPERFALLTRALQRLEQLPATDLPAASVQELWRLVGALGFRPTVEQCVRDGRPVAADGELPFSTADGGALCAQCARQAEVTVLPAEARAALVRLLGGDELPALDTRHAAAHRRLICRYISHHVAEGASLPALEFWLTGAWPKV